MKYRKEFGIKIRDIRKQKNLTQEELAEKAGVAHRTVANIELGAFNPKLETVNDIVQAMDCIIEIKELDNGRK